MNLLKVFSEAWRWRKPGVFAIIWGAIEVLLVLVGSLTNKAKLWWIGGLFWGFWIFLLWIVSDNGKGTKKPLVHSCEIGQMGTKEKLMICLLTLITVISCILPMGISPTWNGEDPQYRNQYEIMAESLLDGRLWMDYYVDPKLEEINPYDDEARKAVGADFHWDHAYYNGRYYMYFGVVPVFLTFIPYRILAGTSLTTFKATQFFTAGIIIGIFLLLYQIANRFFRQMSVAMYTAMAIAVSMMSVWYAVGRPALYCTAITSAICMEVWSLYFFMKSVWCTSNVNKQIMWAFFGAGFGALAFGCRPTIALANILVIPMLCEFLQQNKVTWSLIAKLVLAAFPYVVVAALLMKYNYSRFGSPFEFGQTYQLTLADQSQYADFWSNFDFRRIVNGVFENFVGYSKLLDEFPYVCFSGVYINFPLLLLSFGVVFAPIREKIKEHHLGALVAVMIVVPFIITIADVLWAPFLLERYRMDIYFIMGILCFLIVGIWGTVLTTETQKRLFVSRVTQMAIVMIFLTIWLRIVPEDDNPTAYYPELLQFLERVLLFKV